MIGPRLLPWLTAVLALSSPAAGQDTAQLRTNVALFDELVACSSIPDFRVTGLDAEGPCGDWVERVEAEAKNDVDVILQGQHCLAGDIRLAGVSLISGDEEHFQEVRKSVDRCRAAVR